MAKRFHYAWSTLGKKIVMGLTGLGLTGFVTGHLAGNLLLFLPKEGYYTGAFHNPVIYNQYSHHLTSLGPLLWAIEIGLLAIFFAHLLTGAVVALANNAARARGYEVDGNADYTSKKTFSSKTMIWTGIIVAIFIVIHLLNFKYGVEYKTALPGLAEPQRDFYRLVTEFFSKPLNMGFYMLFMLWLAFHVRHGFWSAFQSLGLNSLRYSKALYILALLIAFFLGIGYLGIPVYIFIGKLFGFPWIA
ncbi:succinate dehydrogenase cytochrome b subunit [bacterium]|nr:succinate dehydrogenase cytochrome b subunit [bacterium]